MPRLLVDTPYSNPHFGDPCTTNALDHLLKCGHKVMTTKPETCASNCMANHAVYANTRDLDQPFACLVCIASTQRSKHVARVAAFTRGLEQEAEVPGILRPQNWIQSELDVVEPMWHQIGQDEMLAKAGAGRFCHAVYFDPEIEILLAELVEKRLWPMAKAKDEEAKAKVMKEKDKQME